MTLIEVMVAAFVLVAGLAGLAVLFATAALATQRSRLDTSSTMVAKLVLEQIAAQDPSVSTPVTVTDCSGTTWTMNTVGGASPSGTGANLNATSGGIDFSQSYGAVTSGYAMRYKDCQSSSGAVTTYDVRWNVITLSSDNFGNVRTRLITVGAHQYGLAYNNLGQAYFAFPVSLRSIAGPLQ